jgi:hypothetical protein
MNPVVAVPYDAQEALEASLAYSLDAGPPNNPTIRDTTPAS